MNTIKPPCASEACMYENLPVGEHHKVLCEEIFAIIRRAGGVALLETAVCPFKALAMIGPQTDPDSAELKSRLGVVAYFEGRTLDD